MFTHIRTSKENKEVVTQLTRKYNLGAENVIARIAISFSLEKSGRLSIEDLKDSGGKEYTKQVLLGDYDHVYRGMISSSYKLHNSSPRIAKYLKLHLDDGLEVLRSSKELEPILTEFL